VLTPNAVDLLPIFDFRASEGKVPFLTPSNSVLWYDPFDTTKQANANILIMGTSGSGKSVAACNLISGYEIATAARGEPAPYVFFLDNGQSYRRYMDVRADARYVSFSFGEPPGVDIWSWSEDEEPLEEHVSRLELLIMDLLKVDAGNEERFERIKAVVDRALLQLYRGDQGRNFDGFAAQLRAVIEETPAGAADLAGLLQALFPFIDGKFKRLFEPNSKLAMSPDVHAICFDFQGLAEHKDLMSIALRLVIYVVRRWSARMARRRHRSFLILDESWAMLDAGSGGASVAATAAPFLASSIRMGRKEGLSVCALSQQCSDFASSAYGAAILGNSATFLVGHPGGEGVEALRKHLRLTDRQCQQVKGLRKSTRWHEFLLIRGEESTVVRVVLDPLARWVFTTSPLDRDRIASLVEANPDKKLMDVLRLLAAEGSHA
jgi:type IV secretory pathway VirB4 component